MTKIATIDRVTVAFEDKSVLSDVSLEITSDDFTCIIGPNGGGKSTLIKVLLGIVKPTSGEVTHHLSPEQRHYGYLPQISDVDRQFPITLSEIVLSGLQFKKGAWGRYSRADKELAHSLMKESGIYELRAKQPCLVSGGELQRALLCRAIISNPKLLVLDEPTTYVDESFGKEIFSWINELSHKMAIVMVSHDLSLVAQYAKKIACVNRSIHFHSADQIPDLLFSRYSINDHPKFQI